MLLSLKMNEDDVCLIDCATTHTIFWDKRYFLKLILTKVNASTKSGITNLIEGSKRANTMLPNGIRFYINNILYSSKFKRNFLNFKDICKNEYHIETMNEGNMEYL